MKALIALTSIVGFLMVVLPGPLYQYAGVSLGTAFTSLRFGVYVGGAALILIILQVLINRKNVSWGSTFICAILALVAVGMPVSMMSKASAVPPIHDITTDVTNPPEFVAIAPLREGAPNSIAYEGGEVTKQQLEAYPEIKTQLLPQPANEVYIAAEKAIEALGWERVNDGALPNTLEATDTTAWFGFKDDVVIRLTAKSDDTLVDIRSKSRVGKSDLGKNAERIETFMAELRNQLGYH
ncbi:MULTISPECIES: DUF1499 domain-containing protein [Alteromonas]|uniref:DUF1499 domain-containing protein n=1 Tax=Alteromonas TaxID=226 RepID=UPI0001AEC054|nr:MULTISPECIES: DUF1499 domain-containing protein [Alteromonas]MCG8496724.1 DUF1499 domain-containing protein [Enterobacterales bacterium]MCP3702246.1 DUF1499 domain-containing protein [Alteromonas sp.]MEC7359159.1 DUF1499 domain-containing protein [Pseudomonadota bacterium]AFS35696.1 hypothetical protein MASE_00615 [Alteromonas macleodii ATCC 27126]MCS5576269.1 DUF1499 domain-containing protein [Alteromonas macleodii]